MRVLIVHHEARYFGGAEVLLGHFLAALRQSHCDVAVALARESRMASAVPPGIQAIWLPENEKFSPVKFAAQLRTLARTVNAGGFDVVHGWAARDWELTAAGGGRTQRPAIGTLHDHPRATYHSRKRQRLMRLVANRGLDRVACTSDAVRVACIHHGYSAAKLAVVHNGIPIPPVTDRPNLTGPLRIGFLGVFSEGKGLSSLFEIVDQLHLQVPDGWELNLAGAAQNSAGEDVIAAIRARYSGQSWWPRVHWYGWADDPMEFLPEIDVLVCPYTQFEAFGLVLCEAAAASVPVVATNIGAVSEIIEDRRTGWLFEPGDSREGARILAMLIRHPGKRIRAGEQARQRVKQKFTIAEMVSGYVKLYSEL